MVEVKRGGTTGRYIEAALTVEPAYGDADQLERGAQALGKLLGVAREQPGHFRADDPAARQGNAERATGGPRGCARR